jgi:carbamoyl-phosphate synthase large subunit
MNLLLTSAGRRNQLLECFRASATSLRLPLRVLAADLRPELSSACRSADAVFAVPACAAPGYVDALLEICAREKVGLLVPTIDPELRPLSDARERFAKIGTTVVVSGPAAVRVARDKLATANALAAGGLPAPRSLLLRDYLRDPSALEGAVIAKPISGSSSAGLVRPRSAAELVGLPADGYVVQEYWSGDEYTVNVFLDSAGRVVSAVPHLRMSVRSGEVSQGRTVRHAGLLAAADRLAHAVPGLRGPVCFQAIVRADGAVGIFELNARFGGGYPLAHEAGARFAQWLLEEAAGLPSSASPEWEEGVLMLRYDAAVFVRDRPA